MVSQIAYAKENRLDLYYYRTHAGAECDVVLTRGHVVKACVEVKYSQTPVLTKGFFQSIADLKCKNNFVITPFDTDIKMKSGVRMVGLKIFPEQISR